MALGAARAIKECGKQGNILVLGFDAISSALNAVQSGELVATIAQYPAEMGILGVQTARKLVKGESVDPVIYTKTEVIDKSKVADFKAYLKKFE